MSEPEQQTPARVLIADDEDDQRRALASLVSSWGFSVETAKDGQDALEKLVSFPAHVLVTDLNMPRMDGYQLLKQLTAQGGVPTAIVVTAFGGIENALKTIHELGAFWFLEKPIRPNELRVLLERAAQQGKQSEEVDRLRRQLSYQGLLEGLVGHSAAMQQVFSMIRQVAPSKAAVLVTGESGTGKELVARAIHNLSPRKGGPFVAINCAAMPESLMESELFGHEKGAFTGAIQRRSGCFELADGGSLLLDEIGDMPIGTQAKLLRVLEDSRVRRLGGKTELDVDVRVVAATNKNVDESVTKGELREDLYYRLNVFHINMPPLRTHKEDILPISDALREDLNRRHDCKATDFHPEVIEKFRQYHWPGNVRELRNVVERAVILAGEGTILPSHLVGHFGDGQKPPTALPNDPDVVQLPVGTTVREAEKKLILQTLEHTGNNKTRAAQILEISLKTLHNKLKDYGTG